MKKQYTLLLCTIFFLCFLYQGFAQTKYISSPNKKVQVTFLLSEKGEPSYSINLNSKLIITKSSLGFTVKNQKTLHFYLLNKINE